MSQVREFIDAHDYPCWCGQKAANVFCKQLRVGRRRFVVLECHECCTQRILPKALPEQSAAETLYNEYAGPDYCDFHLGQFTDSMLKRLRDFDRVPFRLRCNGVRNFLVSLGTFYPESVKRISSRIASARSGDIFVRALAENGTGLNARNSFA